jgi:hypothetical protein
VSAGKSKRPACDRRDGRRAKAEIAAAETAKGPERERTFVDIDPWAVLLEHLMATPEEEPVERKGGKVK